MNTVADLLGVPLPTLKTRPIVTSPITNGYKKQQRLVVSSLEDENKLCDNNDTVDVWKVKRSSLDYDNNNDDDDDTLSTVSSSESFSEDDLTSSLHSSTTISRRSVSFATNMVSNIYYRPVTNKEDKALLYYQVHEYIQMRNDARIGRTATRRTRRDSLVKFVDTIVTDVYEIPNLTKSPDVNTNDLYYTESELQQFLDEFVASLSP